MIYRWLLVMAALSVASIAMAQTTGAAAAQPAVSEAVRVGGVDFQLVLAPSAAVPLAGEAAKIPLALRLTNKGDAAIRLEIFDNYSLKLTDAKGREIVLGDSRRETQPVDPIVLKPGEMRELDCTARLEWNPEKKGYLRLSIPDGAGGLLQTDAIDIGLYSFSAVFTDTIPALRLQTRNDGIPLFHGTATTKELPLKIVDAGHLAPMPATIASTVPAEGVVAPPGHPAVKIVLSGKYAIITVSGGDFPIQNSLPELSIGEQTTSISRYPASGNTDTLIFFMPIETFNKTKDGDLIGISNGVVFDTLDKSKVEVGKEAATKAGP